MTELQQMLADSAAELFAAEVTPELLSAADGGAWPSKLWDVLAAAEYPSLFAEPDPDVTWNDAQPLVLAAGAALAPVPLPETLVASWLLRLAGIAVPAGILTVVPQRATERWHANGTRITGRATGVPWGCAAGHIAVVVDAGERPALALVSAADLARTPDRNVAAEPRDTLEAAAVEAIALAPLGELPGDLVQRFGALVRATQIAGAAGRVLRATAKHAGEREQFGRPIAQFQAISQQLAVMVEETVAASMAAALAWHAAGADPGTRAIAIAKVRAGKAAGIVPAIAHAVHGAIGITAEHSLHFANRRLWAWRAEFGSEAHWARELGTQVLRDGGARLWPGVTAN
jgi:acyl-CoA dehydrogenase